MAHFHSPRIVTDGLVFYYDTANALKSYKGEPTVNYVPGTYDYSLYAYASGPVTAIATNEERKEVAVKRYTITNAVNTARAAIYPNTNTTDYFTFSFKWKYNGTVTASPSMGITASKGNPEGGANNNSIGYERANTVAIGNGWYLTTYTFRFSSNPTGRCMLTFGINTGSNTGYVGETFDIYEAQFEAKAHKTQYVNGTRSSTAALLDLTGNSTINIANVSFDDNAQMTFDGTNDYADLGSYLTNLDTSTISFEIVFKSNTSTGDYQPLIGWMTDENPHGYICTGNFTGQWGDESISFFNYSSGGVGHELSFAYTNGHAFLNDQNYHHVVFTLQSADYRIYVDGVEVAVNPTFRNGSPSSPMTSNLFGYGSTPSVEIGRGSNAAAYANVTVPLVKIYNKVLSAAEVTQNYQAVKSRFGI